MRVLLLIVVLTLTLGLLSTLQAEEVSASRNLSEDTFHNWVATLWVGVQDSISSIQLDLRAFVRGIGSTGGDFGPAIDPDGLVAGNPSSEVKVLKVQND